MSTLRRLAALLRPYGSALVLCAVLALFNAAALLAVPALVKDLLGQAIGEPQPGASPVPLIGVLVGIVLALPVTSYGVFFLMFRISHRVAADLRLAYAASLLRAPMAFHRGHRIGDTLERIAAGLRDIERFVQAHILGSVSAVLLLAGSMAMMFLLSWRLALMVVVAVPLVGLSLRPLHVRIRHAIRETAAAGAGFIARMHEALVGIEVVKAFDAEARELERLGWQQDEILALQKRGASAAALLESLLLTAAVAGVVAVLIYALRLLAARSLRPEDLVAFILYASILIPQSRAITPLMLAWQQLATAMRRVDAIILLPPEPAPREASRLPRPVRGEIRFVGVSHSYPDRPRALQDVDFDVAACDTVGIVGMSGAGKSTLFNLLLKFYEPSEGRILLDGVDLRRLDGSTVRQAMSIVPQDIVLFDGTLLDNVRYGRPGASEEQVRSACRAASAESFLEELPDGLATRVGSRGLTLSGGQRQRLAIARALLKDAPILLLDEATSQLDTQTERSLQEATRAATHGKTTLIIAHRLATVMHLPRLLLMDGGRVVDQGTHDELLGRSDLYRALVATQLIPAVEE